MKKILNLTMHPASKDQKGLIDLQGEALENLKKLLVFSDLPTQEEIKSRATAIAQLAAEYPPGYEFFMIGGAPFLMSKLEQQLLWRGLCPVYAFSQRKSVEKTQPDGSVRKVAVFAHLGWVEGG